MQIAFDPLALFVAVMALWFIIRETRRNNSVILKIKKCTCSNIESINENQGQPFEEFSVLIQNKGVAFYDIQMQLRFTEKDGFGIANFPIKRRHNGSHGQNQFQRGMIAEFSIKSYELDQGDIGFLCNLEDLSKQQAALCFSSQGYIAKTILIISWNEKIKSFWNKIAVQINDRSYIKKGEGITVKPVNPDRFLLPVFQTISFRLEQFIKFLHKKNQN